MFEHTKIIELTHTFCETIPSWNGGVGFRSEIKLDYKDKDTEVKFRVQQIKMHAGIGTHMDAPAHAIEGGRTIEAIPLTDLIVPAVCVDVSAKMSEMYTVSTEDIRIFEQQHGIIQPHTFVIIYTGWSEYWGKPEKYRNHFVFPSISGVVAEYLVSRDIVGLGIDTISPDVLTSGFPVHKTVLKADKYIVENIAHGNTMPPTGAYVAIMPLKGQGLTEAPVRMVGLVG